MEQMLVDGMDARFGRLGLFQVFCGGAAQKKGRGSSEEEGWRGPMQVGCMATKVRKAADATLRGYDWGDGLSRVLTPRTPANWGVEEHSQAKTDTAAIRVSNAKYS